jgi:magnesium chelatase family protein
MPSKIYSAAVIGLDAQVIEVETDVSYGLRCFNIVGLGDRAVEESTVVIKLSRYSLKRTFFQ